MTMSGPELGYYYYGFFTVLRRHRTMTLLGWIVVAVGLAALLIDWRYDIPHGLLDLALAVLTVISGIAMVHLSIVSLDEYLRVPARDLQGWDPETPPDSPLREILDLMADVEKGGWQEAFEALDRLRAIGVTHGLPPLPVPR